MRRCYWCGGVRHFCIDSVSEDAPRGEQLLTRSSFFTLVCLFSLRGREGYNGVCLFFIPTHDSFVPVWVDAPPGDHLGRSISGLTTDERTKVTIAVPTELRRDATYRSVSL